MHLSKANDKARYGFGNPVKISDAINSGIEKSNRANCTVWLCI